MFQFEVDDVEWTSRSSGEVPRFEEAEGFSLGDRIKSGVDIGIIKYVGPVGSHSGTWLGVEWEDPSRGKHSGNVDGVWYFVSSVPNSASFVRPAKVLKLRNLMAAFRERYEDGGDGQVIQTAIKSIEDRLEKKKVVYAKSKVIDLSFKGVNDLSDWEELVQTCPNIEELEISDNTISSWGSIGCLAEGWTNLRKIDLSRNPLENPISGAEQTDSCKNAFLNLKHMIVSGVNYDWDDILQLSPCWPQIAQLTVPYNRISSLKSPSGPLLQLTSIDLEKNSISDWNEVLKLNALERLEHINLCGNRIKTIRFSADDRPTSLFPNLVRLNISENSIQDWLSISELDKLPKLTELRMDVNTVLNNSNRETNRQIGIARIHKLQKLEGVTIFRQERRDAELDYVKSIGSDSSNKKAEILREHPRYEELAKKYGVLETDGKVQTRSNSMKSSLINLVVVAENDLNHTECEKKFLKTMSVQKLRTILQRILKLPAEPIQITVVSSKNQEIAFVLEDEFMELGQYSVEDGDTLKIKW